VDRLAPEVQELVVQEGLAQLARQGLQDFQQPDLLVRAGSAALVRQGLQDFQQPDLLALRAPQAIKEALVRLDQQAALDRLAIRVLRDRLDRLDRLDQLVLQGRVVPQDLQETPEQRAVQEIQEILELLEVQARRVLAGRLVLPAQ